MEAVLKIEETVLKTASPYLIRSLSNPLYIHMPLRRHSAAYLFRHYKCHLSGEIQNEENAYL